MELLEFDPAAGYFVKAVAYDDPPIRYERISEPRIASVVEKKLAGSPEDLKAENDAFMAKLREEYLKNHPEEASQNQPGEVSQNAENYAYRALEYLYNSLKFPSTMQDVSIRVGPYSRAGLSSAIYSTTDEYYVVTISCKAANSFGTLTYDTYVCLFDLTTGKTEYDWEASTDRAMQHAMGAAMINLLSVKNEILALKGQGPLLTPLSRETVDKLVARVKG